MLDTPEVFHWIFASDNTDKDPSASQFNTTVEIDQCLFLIYYHKTHKKSLNFREILLEGGLLFNISILERLQISPHPQPFSQGV